MKKYHLYLWIIALAGLITSCSRDEAAGPQNDASNRVRIGASIDQALQTRAASVIIPANHKLRYVLEVWNTEAEPACIYRDEKTTTEATAVVFDFVLTEARNYKALLWADFVATDAAETTPSTPNTYTHYTDNHYTTANLKGIIVRTGASYKINDESRDAFFACIPIEKGTGAFAESVELTRPFGQINIIEKNTSLISKVEKMSLTYDVPKIFNVETGTPSETTGRVTPEAAPATATAVRKANLFYDFIFAPTTGQFTMTGIEMKFTSNDAHVTLPDYKIPANMPVVRNKRTNISGSILTANSNDVKLTVAVSDAWTLPDDKQDLDVPAARAILDAAKTAGSGNTASDYTYTITTAEQLAALATLTNAAVEITGSTGRYRDANYLLANDIDLENSSWTPIGKSNMEYFSGDFDGQGYTIRNLNVNVRSTHGSLYAGLFGIISGNISNLIVEGTVTASGTSYCFAGGICAAMAGIETIEFCRFNGSVSSTTTSGNVPNCAGGITGNGTTLKGCISDATVTISGGDIASSGAGGLAGGVMRASYSAWNSNKTSTGIELISAANFTDCNGFTDIAGLNNLLSGINNGVPASTYLWKAGATAADYPTLQKR